MQCTMERIAHARSDQKESVCLCQNSAALLQYLSAGVNPAIACSAQLLPTSDEAGRCHSQGTSTDN